MNDELCRFVHCFKVLREDGDQGVKSRKTRLKLSLDFSLSIKDTMAGHVNQLLGFFGELFNNSNAFKH